MAAFCATMSVCTFSGSFFLHYFIICEANSMTMITRMTQAMCGIYAHRRSNPFTLSLGLHGTRCD